MKAPKYTELRKMSDEELERLHDRQAESTEIGLGWLMDELHRRAVARQTTALVRLTWAIAALTLLNLVIIAATLLE